MHISDSGRLDRPAYAVDANAKRPARRVQAAVVVSGVIFYVVIALLSAVVLQQSGAGVAWTPLG